MIFNPTNFRLYCFEFTGASVSMDIDTIKPIQMALESDGGKIGLVQVYLPTLKKDAYWINYDTNDGRIRMSYSLTKEEYLYHLDFFGSSETIYDSGIKFELDNNKFRLP